MIFAHDFQSTVVATVQLSVKQLRKLRKYQQLLGVRAGDIAVIVFYACDERKYFNF